MMDVCKKISAIITIVLLLGMCGGVAFSQTPTNVGQPRGTQRNTGGAKIDSVLFLPIRPLITWPYDAPSISNVGGLQVNPLDSLLYYQKNDGVWYRIITINDTPMFGSGVTLVNSGFGLSGGPITDTGTLKVDTSKIPTMFHLDSTLSQYSPSSRNDTSFLKVGGNANTIPLTWGTTGGVPIIQVVNGVRSCSTSVSRMNVYNSKSTLSTGTDGTITIIDTVNQSSTARHNAVWIRLNNVSTGSGGYNALFIANEATSGTALFSVSNTGAMTAATGAFGSNVTATAYNATSSNTAAINVSAGTVISRNLADNVPALVVNNVNASSTGALQVWRSVGAAIDSIRTDGVLVVRGLRGAGGTPTATAGAGAGTSPTITPSGTDLAGNILIAAGTLPTPAATIATITFANAKPSTPRNIVLNGLDANSRAAIAAGNLYAGFADFSTTAFIIKGTLTASTSYRVGYIIVE